MVDMLLDREVNQILEGNQQHDAHELLVCLLNNNRETCRYLADQHKLASEQSNGLLTDPLDTATTLSQTTSTSSSNSGRWGVRKSWKRKKAPVSSQKGNTNIGLPNGLGPEHPPLLNGAIGGHQSVTGETGFI